MASVCSMTGFANGQGSCPLGTLSIELRCVNSRFLDLTLRMPEELRMAEPAVRDMITRRVARGKLECRISLKTNPAMTTPRVSPEAVEALRSIQQCIMAIAPDAKPLTVSQILAYPGIVSSGDVNADELVQSVLSVLSDTIDTFTETREREGAALARVIEGYCDQIVAVVTDVSDAMPLILQHIQSKLTERLEHALSKTLSENSTLSKEEVTDRIRQEVTLYALKIDVDEEINRLLTHVKEVRRVLAAGGATGRRLDFLMQEMNREANTLGSKAAAIEMTNASLSLKLCIEQMREQIQNLQ